MKKLISLVIAAAMTVSMVGCAEKKPATPPPSEKNAPAPETPATPAPEGGAAPAPEGKEAK
jgi:predicted small lipoprotein YifL